MSDTFPNYSDLFREGFCSPVNAALSKVAAQFAEERAAAESKLTEKQFVEAMRQALACGDFLKLCTVGSSYVLNGRSIHEYRQAITYEPFRERQRLEARIAELEQRLKDAGLPLKENPPNV